MPYKTGKMKGELTTAEIRKLIRGHNILTSIKIPKGATRDEIIKMVEQKGYMINHEKKSLDPKGGIRKGQPRVKLEKAKELTKPKPKTELQKQKAAESKAEKEEKKKKEERAIRKKAVEEEKKRVKPKPKPKGVSIGVGTDDKPKPKPKKEEDDKKNEATDKELKAKLLEIHSKYKDRIDKKVEQRVFTIAKAPFELEELKKVEIKNDKIIFEVIRKRKKSDGTSTRNLRKSNITIKPK